MCQCRLNRRAVLGIIAAAPLAMACTPQSEGPETVRYNRETCAMCGMIISDARFAAEIRGGPKKALVKFDDIGDAVHWLEFQPWRAEPGIEFWVMDSVGGTDWLDARKAFYEPGVVSPMDYGYGAVAAATAGTVGFEEMRKAVLERGLSSRCPPPGEESAA